MKYLTRYSLLFLIAWLTTLSAGAQNLRFAWLTDIHIVRGSQSLADLRKSVADINSMSDVQFTILTGDISDFGYKEDMLIGKQILDSLRKPYYIVPGNHDTKWTESGATGFDEVFGHHNIQFNAGNIAFVGFQTGPIARRGDGYVTADDLAWIREQCENAKKSNRTIIPYTHYPLNRSMANWFELTKLFKEYDVRVVLVGHGHRNNKMNFEGLPGVMARTNTSRNNAPVGYTLVDVTRDSILFTERNPDIDRVTTWHSLPFVPVDYSKNNTPYTPEDYVINAEYPQVKEKWKLHLTGGVSSAVAYAGNRVFVGDRNGAFYCLQLKDGKTLWQFKAGKGIFSTPAIAGDRVVFGSVDNSIYCLDIKTGKPVWQFKADSYVLGSAAIHEGKVFIGASDGKFRALDLRTGKLVWEFGGIRAWIDTKPVVYQGNVYFGAWDNYFYALNANTGKLAWKWIRSEKEAYPSSYYAPGACWPVAAHDRIFITGPDMVLTAINAKTGDSLWRVGAPKLNEAIGISADGNRIFVKCTFDSTLIAYNAAAAQPEVVWKTVDHYGFDDNQAAIIEKNGIVYFPFRNGWLIAVNSRDGKLLWKHKISNIMLNPATPVSEKEVIVSDEDGNLVLLESK